METIIDLFERSCSYFPEHAYLWEKRNGKYESTSYARTKERVLFAASGLLKENLHKGERVALLSEGCRDWICGELAVLYAGGISVPLSIKLTEQELIFRLNHSGSRFIIVSAYYAETLKRIRSSLIFLEKIFILGEQECAGRDFYGFERLVEEGKKWLTDHKAQLKEVMRSVRAEDVANISYTSGTTAEPKGIMLTHGNYVSNVLQADSLVRIPSFYKIVLFLPWDHSFAHTVGIYSFMYNGASIAAVDFGNSPLEYLRNIPVSLREVKPHVLLSVPAIAKNFRKNIESAVRQKGKTVRKLYAQGLKIAYAYYGLEKKEKRGWKYLLYPLVKWYDRFVFSGIRKSFGGNLQFFIGGGALLDVELQKYFRALGIPMYQGYGLSEASPVISSNTPQAYKFGSSGKIVEPMELKICRENGETATAGEEGEIVIRGGNVMKGYWKNESSTQEVLREGWLYTGDMGYVDPQGFLYVLGRFKTLLIADDGEKYSPEGIEESIVERSPYIDYCMLYNNQCAYTVGLIVPNKTALKEYLQEKEVKFGSIEGYKLMLSKIRSELMEYRPGGKFGGLFPERWLPAVSIVLPESFGEQNGTINSTSKMVRRRITELYRNELDYAYTSEGKDMLNTRNTRNIKQYMG